MKLVIDIDEELYKQVFLYGTEGMKVYERIQVGTAIRNGTPLPKWHGDLIDASKIRFENSEFDTYGDYSRAFDAIDQAEAIIKADKEE